MIGGDFGTSDSEQAWCVFGVTDRLRLVAEVRRGVWRVLTDGNPAYAVGGGR